MFRYLRKIIFNKYIWLLFVPLLIAWFMLTMRLRMRTDFAMHRQLPLVKRIWGGNLEQPMPSVRYKNFGSDVSTLSKGEHFIFGDSDRFDASDCMLLLSVGICRRIHSSSNRIGEGGAVLI